MILLAKAYQVRPSQYIQLDDDYEAFCFDEACAVILSRTNQGERCNFSGESIKENDKKNNLISFFQEYEKEQKGVNGFGN